VPPIDEMLTDGSPRPSVTALWESITGIGAEGLQQRGVLRSQLEFESDAISPSASEEFVALARRAVCQDDSHVTISLLRSLGVPARYVSGYHYTGAGEIDEPVIVESHAWLEAWAGEWIPFDPTNGLEVGERNVTVAVGRDYSDVTVTMTRQSR
jgi:transglutaminase-like putative cysteine protease